VYYGNAAAYGVRGDDVNNVEQVIISKPPSGKYTVTLTSTIFGSGSTQSVAVVITSIGLVLDLR
jgi:hypothetical protein